MDIYKVTENFPTDEKFGLISQLRRAAVSVPSNIVEGMGKNGLKDFIRFLYQARGSIYEILAQLEIAHDLHYLKETEYNNLKIRYNGLSAGINQHIKSLNNQNNSTTK